MSSVMQSLIDSLQYRWTPEQVAKIFGLLHRLGGPKGVIRQ